MFSRRSTRRLFAALACGMILADRSTVVAMAAAGGMADRWRRACWFFSAAVWNIDELGLAVARLIVKCLLTDGEPVVVAVDGTFFRRWGRNRVRAEIAEAYGVSQPAISRAISAITPLLVQALIEYVPTADDLDPRTCYLIHGTLLPCWPWARALFLAEKLLVCLSLVVGGRLPVDRLGLPLAELFVLELGGASGLLLPGSDQRGCQQAGRGM